jgi:hypothetical protein
LQFFLRQLALDKKQIMALNLPDIFKSEGVSTPRVSLRARIGFFRADDESVNGHVFYLMK